MHHTIKLSIITIAAINYTGDCREHLAHNNHAQISLNTVYCSGAVLLPREHASLHNIEPLIAVTYIVHIQ